MVRTNLLSRVRPMANRFCFLLFLCWWGGSLLLLHAAPSGQAAPAARASSETEPQILQQFSGTVQQVNLSERGGLELVLQDGASRRRLSVAENAGLAPLLGSCWQVAFDAPASQTTNASAQIPEARIANFNSVQPLDGRSLVPLVSRISQLQALSRLGRRTDCVFLLRGTVLGVARSGRFLALQDDTGAAVFSLPTAHAPVVEGQTILLRGNGQIEADESVVRDPPLVNNDYLHTMIERSGTIYLRPGKVPFSLAWFNQLDPHGLQADWEGPNLSKTKIPAAALFHRVEAAKSGVPEFEPGVHYACFEGQWLRVADFANLAPSRQGITKDFDVRVAGRTAAIGIVFSGFIDIPREGFYKFSVSSDDGSLLYVNEQSPEITLLGTDAVPAPARVSQMTLPRAESPDLWCQTEGVVSFAARRNGRLVLGLISAAGVPSAEILDPGEVSPEQLLNSRVRIRGVLGGAYGPDGQTSAGQLQAPGLDQLEILDSGRELLAGPSASGTNALPLLTSVEQIKQLKRADWQSHYPVRLRGVITTLLDSGFFLRDATRSIYVRWQPPTGRDLPHIGDYWEVEGVTFAEFAPNVEARRAVRLGRGCLPEPLLPSWDQLINGSLDTEYVEIRGILTTVDPPAITLLTRSGTVRLELPELQPQSLAPLENCLVRVRGCVIPVRNIATQQVEVGRLKFSNVSICVDEPAPKEPFAGETKPAVELLRFDSRAGAFQRVKVAGQILHAVEADYYLQDGAVVLRIVPRQACSLEPGDRVEVSGFLVLGGLCPLIREALVRNLGHAPLPAPEPLPADQLVSNRYEGRRVQVRAHLTASTMEGTAQILELQSGSRTFPAELDTRRGRLPELRPGSQVELTGVYQGRGGDAAAGKDIDSFKLLLTSPADLKVLDQPSWWTARHVWMLAGGLALVLLFAFIWITQLQRLVEVRSAELAEAVRRREQSERQRQVEVERARIARDLHDDLGATLTQIRFLSALGSRDAQVPESTRQQLQQVSEKSRQMVASLDEIVWAVNPINDTLPSLASYLCHVAEEFFRATAIRCRIDVADPLPRAPLTSEVRHHLFLAVREAMNNVIKHSKATEVWLRIQYASPELCVTIEDNGRGFSPEASDNSGDGLTNLHQRMAQVGGRCELHSAKGAGTRCQLWLRLDLHPLPA